MQHFHYFNKQTNWISYDFVQKRISALTSQLQITNMSLNLKLFKKRAVLSNKKLQLNQALNLPKRKLFYFHPDPQQNLNILTTLFSLMTLQLLIYKSNSLKYQTHTTKRLRPNAGEHHSQPWLILNKRNWIKG